MSIVLGKLRKLPNHRKCFSICQPNRGKKTVPNPWDLATGLERWQAVQAAKGIADPFHELPRIKKQGTKDCPIVVPSFHDKRIVGCICNSETTRIVYWWIHEGFPRRCECNYWFVLERIPPMKIYEDC